MTKEFLWKRAHSLSGLWLTLFLIIHLLTNSQSALLLGQDGLGFIHSANALEDLPFLPVLEILLLAIPFAIHSIWGIQYLLLGKPNSFKTDGTTPSLPEYQRNHAYTWQRITSWLLLILITMHVIHMRFMDSPTEVQKGDHHLFMVRIQEDSGIFTLAERLGVTLYHPQEIQQMHVESQDILDPIKDPVLAQTVRQDRDWVAALKSMDVQEKQLIAVADNFGAVELLMLRDTFKIPMMLFLYTVLVLSACFHGFNGLWTFMITWGVTLSPSSQNHMRKIAYGLMGVIAFLGLASVWGTYWINLKK